MAEQVEDPVCGCVGRRGAEHGRTQSLDLCGDRIGSCGLVSLQGQNLGDRSPKMSCKQNMGNRTRQERGCQQGGIAGKASDPVPQASPQTLPYKAYPCPCPPGFSLPCPAASCLWAHAGPESSGFPLPLPLPPCCCLSFPGLHGVRSPS